MNVIIKQQLIESVAKKLIEHADELTALDQAVGIIVSAVSGDSGGKADPPHACAIADVADDLSGKFGTDLVHYRDCTMHVMIG